MWEQCVSTSKVISMLVDAMMTFVLNKPCGIAGGTNGGMRTSRKIMISLFMTRL